ncbi:MAG: hypothetical protein JO265_03325 [Acidimicrobiia bacterium]|nr:hypothetical protein [Acidimicrobiia bacterium]
MRRSPVALGLVLGLTVGVAGVAALATTAPALWTAQGRPAPVGVPARHQLVIVMATPPKSGDGGRLEVEGRLPPLADRSRGFRLSDQLGSGAVERLADALGVHAPVQGDAGGWIVRQDNRLVRVTRTAGFPWYFAVLDGRCTLVPSETLAGVPPPDPTGCPQPQGQPNPASRPPPLPSQDEALAFGMETLGRAGLGVSRPVIVDEGTVWHIEASPLIGQQPTSGLTWTVTVGPSDAVTAASGFLAAPQAADTYELAGTEEGLLRARAVAAGTVTAVRLGLMLGRLGDAPYLVPAYLFELQGPAGTPPPIVPVPAVQDRYLA